MSRQGLMDDSGYDFFDVSDCANYESCREDAYNDGYEKGKADGIREFARYLVIDGYIRYGFEADYLVNQFLKKEQNK